jgi:gamma-glutamylcyclotransferase
MKKMNSKESMDKFAQELSQGVLYFAYGSNLSLEQMNKRCPESVKIGKGILKNYMWIINSRGFANVVKSPLDYVEGTVYVISKQDEDTLDKKEGVKLGCYEKKTLRILMGTFERECLVYVDPIVTEGIIKLDYAQKINVGIIDSKLSPHYVEKYVQKFMPDCSFDHYTEKIMQYLESHPYEN